MSVISSSSETINPAQISARAAFCARVRRSGWEAMLIAVGGKAFMRRTAPKAPKAQRSLARPLRIASEPVHKEPRTPLAQAFPMLRYRRRNHTKEAALRIAQSDPRHTPASAAVRAAHCARRAPILDPILQNQVNEPAVNGSARLATRTKWNQRPWRATSILCPGQRIAVVQRAKKA